MKRSIIVAMCAALLLVAGACSSGGGDDEGSDGGGDGGGSGTIKIYAVATINAQLEVVATTYEEDSGGTKIEYTFGPAEELAQKIIDGDKPDVFIARPAQVSQVREAGKSAGDPAIFGFDVLEIVTPPGNPGDVSGIDAFAGDAIPTGICPEKLTCGRNAIKAFETAGIISGATVVDSGAELRDRIISGEFEAGLLYRTQWAPKTGQGVIVVLPEDLENRIDYQMIQITPGQNGANFIDWIKNSKTAVDTLREVGLRPPAAEPAPSTP